MQFDFVFLGQSVLKYQVPLEVFVGLNELYETQKKNLPNANKQLAGKIPDEVSLFYAGPTNKKMHAHNYVPVDIMKWFYYTFDHYLNWNKIQEFKMDINSIWINEMKAGDYNPVHIHQGRLYTGDYSPKMKIGDFYVFPYDMRHVVYPFTNKKEKRRTLVCNCDVHYNSVISRTAQ